jgi:hypothetical protein
MPDGSVKKPVRFVVPKPKPRPMDGPATLIGVGPGTQVQIRQLEVDYNLKRIPNKGYSNTRMKRFTNFQVVMYTFSDGSFKMECRSNVLALFDALHC